MSRTRGQLPVDLDQPFWGPGWTPVAATDFHAAARRALAGTAWIADGNYGGSVAEILLKHAELTIWLDLPLRTCLPRLIRRSIRRAVTGESCSREAGRPSGTSSRATRFYGGGRPIITGTAAAGNNTFTHSRPASCRSRASVVPQP
ncbi:hypothetical protein [Salinispora arenicola]|uniref:hypothetical protein n=1 Tax=Salinispora arenicola TaxID=168697 RepID=UPI0006814590|nr:hypothetical protein [Salinispora arenicola]NIL59746.1 hypothetical protein [Salinispora arenicola]NIL64684.1 hypothetical protein [Salinispora arenicola]